MSRDVRREAVWLGVAVDVLVRPKGAEACAGLFDHLIGAGEQSGGNFKSKRLGSL